MSVIVWDGSILAVDTFANDGRTSFPVEKLWKIGDAIIAACGMVSDIAVMHDWYMSGQEKAKFPKVTEFSEFVVATPARGLVRYKMHPFPMLHGRDKVAFGTGRQFALGAMHAGAGAVEAVEAAIKYDPSCGGEAKWSFL